LLYSKSAIKKRAAKKAPIVIPFKKAWKNKWFVVETCKLWEYVTYYIFYILEKENIYAKFENVFKYILFNEKFLLPTKQIFNLILNKLMVY